MQVLVSILKLLSVLYCKQSLLKIKYLTNYFQNMKSMRIARFCLYNDMFAGGEPNPLYISFGVGRWGPLR